MKATTLILGILGGLVAGALGFKWLGDFGQLNEMQRAMGGEQLQAMGTAGLLMLLSLVAGIAGGILGFRGKFAAGGLLMLAGGILPLLFAKQALLFMLPLVAGGVVALVGHFKVARPAAGAGYG